jgi:drug/metabolite transporter superfamily protein YnfA
MRSRLFVARLARDGFRRDLIGAGICLVGVLVIMDVPRG